MIPELTLVCGQKEYVCTSVSAKMYRRYTEVMEKNNGSGAASALFLVDCQDFKFYIVQKAHDVRFHALRV